MEGLITWLK